MTLEELRAELQQMVDQEEGSGYPDLEVQHMRADALLIKYIGDPEVARLFDELGKWYA